MLLCDLSIPGLDNDLKAILEHWGIRSLTEIQRLAIEAGVFAGEGMTAGSSMVVSAPTSSGKTLVGELALLSAVRKKQKAIYLVSHKALADQKYIDFKIKFTQTLLGTTENITVGLSTGDHEIGDVNPLILIATYEKALALLLSKRLQAAHCVVVADELQIMGESGRGAHIEILCSLLRLNQVSQFVALTATLGNPKALSDWLQCQWVYSEQRAVDLNQEIWHASGCDALKLGETAEHIRFTAGDIPYDDVILAVAVLLERKLGPVLVFTESRKEAAKYADEYAAIVASLSSDSVANAAQNKPKTLKDNKEKYALLDALDWHSEPTEISAQLKKNAENKIAFHTADLTPQEREVIEAGFLSGDIEVCFATSTLAAGVNFPFQTVVFPKLTYQWGTRAHEYIGYGDYRNMSGRAGRLGLHPQGHAILLAKNAGELAYARRLVLPENAPMGSQLPTLSLQRTLLVLIAARAMTHTTKLNAFFEHTFFWHQTKDSDPTACEIILRNAQKSLEWLLTHQLVKRSGEVITVSPLGRAIARSGLLPTTALAFLEMMQPKKAEMEQSFEDYFPSLILWVALSDEFQSANPSRFLPFPTSRYANSAEKYFNLRPKKLFEKNYIDTKILQCAYAATLYAQGVPELSIVQQTSLSSGSIHHLAIDFAWVLEGLQQIIGVAELGYSRRFIHEFQVLTRRVKQGVTPQGLDLLALAQEQQVPGVGRQRVMALVNEGFTSLQSLINAPIKKLAEILKSTRRADALMQAISCFQVPACYRYQKTHIEQSSRFGLEYWVSESYNAKTLDDYLLAIGAILKTIPHSSVESLRDDFFTGFLLKIKDKTLMIDCKIATHPVPILGREQTFALLKSPLCVEKNPYRVVLGKPAFDEPTKIADELTHEVALIEHAVFIENILAILEETREADAFLDGFSVGGFVDR